MIDDLVREKGNEWFIAAKLDAIKQALEPLKTTYLPQPADNELQSRAIANMQ